MVRTHAATATGVGYESVKTSEGIDMTGDKCGDIVFDSDVGDLMTDSAGCARCLDPIDNVNEAAFGAPADRDVHSVIGEAGGTRSADSGSASGDDRGATSERRVG
jgi:hypothetical protein